MLNFRSTTDLKFQNIKSVFLVHHCYDNQNIKSVFLVHHYYNNQNIIKRTSKLRLLMFWFYLWRQKRSERQKSKTSTTYGVLPMVAKACGGLG